MRKIAYLVLFVLPAVASEGGEGSGVLLWKAVNMAVLLGIIYYFGGKYIKKFLEDRRQTVACMVEEAQRAKEESVRALQEANSKLEEANYRLQEGIRIAQETARQERESALRQANEMAERIKKQAEESIAVEIRKAEVKLKKYAAQKALEISSKLIKENVNPQTTKALVEKSLKRLEA